MYDKKEKRCENTNAWLRRGPVTQSDMTGSNCGHIQNNLLMSHASCLVQSFFKNARAVHVYSEDCFCVTTLFLLRVSINLT